MTETICLLACFALIEMFVIVFLLCSLSDIKGQRKVHNEMYTEMESRALNAESDLTQEMIEKDRVQVSLKKTNEVYKNMLDECFLLTEENESLKSDLLELKEKHSRKNQKRVNGKFA